jgi:molybdate transport system regulatory protein
MATVVKTKVWLELSGRFVIGDGGLQLLLGIDRSGSLAAASKAIGWSYRHAWGYIRRAEEVLGASLTSARPGRGASRGTELTDLGQEVLERLRRVRARVDGATGPTGPTHSEIAARGRSSGRQLRRRRAQHADQEARRC